MDEGEKTSGMVGRIRGGRTTLTIPEGGPLAGQVRDFAQNKGGEVKEVAGGKEVRFVDKILETTLPSGVRIADVPPGTPGHEVMEKVITKGGVLAVGSSEDYPGGIKGGQRYVLPPEDQKSSTKS